MEHFRAVAFANSRPARAGGVCIVHRVKLHLLAKLPDEEAEVISKPEEHALLATKHCRRRNAPPERVREREHDLPKFTPALPMPTCLPFTTKIVLVSSQMDRRAVVAENSCWPFCATVFSRVEV